MDPLQKSADAVDPLIAHLNIYAVADKYDIGLLKELAKLKFSAILHEHRIQGNDLWIQNSFPDIVARVYDTTMASEGGLRDCLLPLIKDHWTLLRGEAAFMNLVRSVEDLAVNIIDAWTSDRAPLIDNVFAGYGQGHYSCPVCKTHKLFDVFNNGGCGRCRSCLHEYQIDSCGAVGNVLSVAGRTG